MARLSSRVFLYGFNALREYVLCEGVSCTSAGLLVNVCFRILIVDLAWDIVARAEIEFEAIHTVASTRILQLLQIEHGQIIIYEAAQVVYIDQRRRFFEELLSGGTADKARYYGSPH